MPSPEHRQQRLRPHGQRDMPIPSHPTPYFIVIQPDLALRLCKAPFHGPAAAGHLHHRLQHGRLGGTHDVRRERCRSAQTPAHPEPPPPGGLQRRGQGEPLPVIPARAFGAVPSPQPTPTLRRQRCQDRFDRVWPTRPPDLGFARDGQHMGVALGLPP